MTCRTLEAYYHINAHTFEKQYKETLSGFRSWEQLAHADTWLLFPENIGPHLAIDESSLSNGELYTFVTNRDRHTGEGSLVAVVSGTKSEDVIQVLKLIDEEERMKVKEVTLDLSDSMRKIVSVAFPKAQRVIDRFHIQKLACDAVQEIRVAHRWDALQQANDEMEECKHTGKTYVPFRFPNGDTRPELLIRSRYLLFKSADKWTERQKERAEILFKEYPDIKLAYGLSHSLRMIDEILNFYNNRSSNAAAESFNAKIKLFRANLHGVTDKKFFLFRIAKLYGYPQISTALESGLSCSARKSRTNRIWNIKIMDGEPISNWDWNIWPANT